MLKKNILTFSLIAMAAGPFLSAHAASSCANYPYSSGMELPEQDDKGNWKLVATGVADVQFDDLSSVNEARSEATMDAKAHIVRFLSETATVEESSTRIATQIVEKQGAGDSATKTAKEQSVKESLKRLASSGSALLRGALTIGDCYTPGREYRVTVGIKSDTVQAASQAGAAISGTPDDGHPMSDEKRNTNPAPGGDALTTSPGHSNTKNLGKF